MSQVALFRPRAGERPQMRWYQAECVEAVMHSLREHQRTLIVCATGAGKTQIFSEVALRVIDAGRTKGRGRVLCLAHRKELVQQAAERLELVTGDYADIEMAELWASNRARIVCASLASLAQPRRLQRWARDHFDLVIVDEAHHAVAETFMRVLDHFNAPRLGVTATPGRSDGRALGKAFSHVAYTYDILDGINDGYLVPIVARTIRVDEIDLSDVEESAGDLQVGQLDEAMLEGVEGIVKKTLELAPDRQGIWFFPGVKSAELACDRINALMPGSCAFICGETPPEERDYVVKGFKSGRFTHLTNCAVATEGFDAPSADMVVLARPTKSAELSAQMVGRGLRVLPGLVDGYRVRDAAGTRRALIAGSAKPNCLVLDFVGNAGKHSLDLVTTTDLLGGKYTEAEVKRAKEKVKEGVAEDIIANLEAARLELKALMGRLQSRVKATVEAYNPFSKQAPSMGPPPITPATIHQLRRLVDEGVSADLLKGISRLDAHRMIARIMKRRQLGLATVRQVNLLKKHGVDARNVRFETASKAILFLQASGWRPNPEQLRAIVEAP